jgi:hypothetical protein
MPCSCATTTPRRTDVVWNISTTYFDFPALWKGADPDIPILLAAKAEYAMLK